MRYLHTILMALLIPAFALAGEAPPAKVSAGRYVLPGNWGTLLIEKVSAAKSRFEIESIGGNCHTCSVAGIIRGKTGYADSGEEASGSPRCEISFNQVGKAIDVRPVTPEACREFCGNRAGFDGTYKTPPANCSRTLQQSRRDEFLKLYRSRKFAEASEKISLLLEECGEFISWIEIDKVRNDLALAQLRDGKPLACLETLAATRAAASSSGDELGLPPCDYDNYIGVAKATWHNRSLCEKASSQR